MYKILKRRQLNENVVLMEVDAPMYRIVKKESLNPTVTRMVVEAPAVARKAEPGQFIILRVDEKGERIPLTISDYDREKGTITIIFQIVGQTTMLLSQLKEGDALLDFVGPLGKATDFEGAKKVCVIGGGVGNAIAYPSAKQLFNEGVEVDVIAGFRNKDIVILEEEMSHACTDLHICTDDGTYGYHGFVTGKLEELIAGGVKFDHVFAIIRFPLVLGT